ncbi:hypothetical protein [Duganella hordei]|uniref:hypothetical protein n=1 Tax=Duganella hordei TaxID=2865934 RepID=UPI00333FEC5E
MQRTERRKSSNRATTAIINAGMAMRRHKGSAVAIKFLIGHGVEPSTITRVLCGPSRDCAYEIEAIGVLQ